MKNTSLYLMMLAIVVVSTNASAREIVDDEFGFRMWASDDFQELQIDPSDQDLIYQLVAQPMPQGSPATLIQIQRLHGVIDPNTRYSKDDLPPMPNTEVSFDEIDWNGLNLQVLKLKIEGDRPEETTVGFGVQFPLSGEAVQLQVGGPLARESEIRELFNETVKQFVTTKPLSRSGGEAAGTSSRQLTTGARIYELIKGTVGIIFVAIFIFLMGRMLVRNLQERWQRRSETDSEQ